MCSVISSRRVMASCTSKLLRNYGYLGKVSSNCPCGNGINDFGSGWYLTVRGVKFARKPTRIYLPKTVGAIPAKESLAKLPNDVKQEEAYQRLKTSSELFKSVMGDIFMNKNKHLIAVEGIRQVSDAISFGLEPKMMFLLKTLKALPANLQKIVDDSEGSQGAFEGRSKTPEIHRIKLGALQDWSSLTTPPGIVGIFDKPTTTVVQKANLQQTVPLTVVLDNVREPGNLGAILRTAAGIGCKVILSHGCAEPWETKSLRGGNGAQFLVPMLTKVDLKYLHQFIPLPDFPTNEVEASETNDNSLIVDREDNSSTNGRSGVGVFLADSGSDPDSFGIPIVNYTSIQYSKLKAVVLILGGETCGLSETVKKAVNELPQYYPEDVKMISRIKIPMSMPIDSLNVGNAFGIIGYEILRQLSSN